MAKTSSAGRPAGKSSVLIVAFCSGAALITTTSSNVAIAAEPEVAKPRVVGVEWPDAGPISVSGTAEARLEGVDRTLLPVLIPKSFLTYKSLVFVGDPLEYSATVTERGATLAITGTRIAIDTESDAVADASEQIRSAVREQNAEASVNRFGAAYQVTIECTNKGDPRCASDSKAISLLRSVELVGGGRDAAPPSAPQTPPLPTTIPVSSDPNFRAEPPGELKSGSGNGVRTSTVYAPGIRFPVSVKPVYLNSQVWNPGGTSGGPGGQSDPKNFRYPWHDNFCEKRHWRTPMCPGGTGHQGVDIRPSKPSNRDRQMGVAVESGRITYVGRFKVTLAGDSGTHYNYLHMRNVTVRPGDRVAAGKALGVISNNFGDSSTTYHLHFEIQQNRNGRGWVHVPPYSSLVAAYERL